MTPWVQTQVNLASLHDEPGVRLAVRSVQVLSRERDVRMGMYGEPLPSIEQLDE